MQHTQGSEKIRELSNYKKSQGDSRNFDFLKTQGSFDFFWKFQESLGFHKKSEGKFFIDLEWDLLNPVSIFCSKKLILFISKCLFRNF